MTCTAIKNMVHTAALQNPCLSVKESVQCTIDCTGGFQDLPWTSACREADQQHGLACLVRYIK